MAEDNSEFTRRNIIEPSGAAFDQIMGELEFVAEEHGALPTAAAATYATLSWVVSVAPSSWRVSTLFTASYLMWSPLLPRQIMKMIEIIGQIFLGIVLAILLVAILIGFFDG